MTSVIKPCGEIDLAALKLSHGSHGSQFAGECCLIECSNLLATCDVDLRERFGKPDGFDDDHPSISRVVRSFAIALNDKWLDSNGDPRGWWCPAEAEALLRPYAARVLGSRTTDADEEVRRYLCIDWAARTAAPMWLDAVGQAEDAATLRALPAIVNEESRTAARTLLGKIAAAAFKRRNAAWERYYEARRRVAAPPPEAVAAAVAAAVAVEAVAAAVAAAVAVEAEEAVAAVAVAVEAEEAAVAVAVEAEEAVAAVEAEEAVAAVAVEAEEAVAAVAVEAAAKLRPTVEQVSRSALALLDQLIAVGYEHRRPAWRGVAIVAPKLAGEATE